MITSRFFIKTLSLLIPIFMLLVFLALSSCRLETGAIAPSDRDPFYDPPPLPSDEREPNGSGDGDVGSWNANAFPGYACPVDQISLQWNVGDPLCPAGTGPTCQTLTVRDNLGLLSPPFTSRDLTGAHVNGSIADLGASWSGTNPVFTFTVAHDDPGDPGWATARSEVVIVQNPPAEPVARNFKVFSAACDGLMGWRSNQFRIDMSQEDFIVATRGLGPCVRITSVCYLPNDAEAKRPNPVVVSLVGGGPMTATTLSMGECRDGLNLRPDLAYDVQPATPTLPMHEGNCVPGDVEGDVVTDPPFTQLLFTFGCDTRLDECGN